MNIRLLNPYHSGSHKYWAENIKLYSSYPIELEPLKGRFWKWRMQGAAIELQKKVVATDAAILTTDMTNVGLLKALLAHRGIDVPILLYMHENQLAHPASINSKEWDRTYAWINYTSCLTANQIIWNSEYNKNSFINSLKQFLSILPDYHNLQTIREIKTKSQVIPLGIDSQRIRNRKTNNTIPTILWNHRWEHDKNPQLFFDILIKLHNKGLQFSLIVCGENFRNQPEIFRHAKEKLHSKILHWGYANTKTEYYQLLEDSDILPVTSCHDFFGIAVLEAVAAGVFPLLPYDLAYPEHFNGNVFYYNETQFAERLQSLIMQHPTVPKFKSKHLAYSWKKVISKLDTLLSQSIKKARP